MTELAYYKLRLTVPDTDSIIHYLDHGNKGYPISETYVVVKEGVVDPDKQVHHHLYFETLVKNATIRSHIRNIWGHIAERNALYSMKTIEDRLPLEYLAYLMKEGAPVYKNISSETIESASLVQEEKQKAHKEKKRKAKKSTQVELLMEEFQKTWEAHEYHIDHVIRDVVRYYKTSDTLIREFSIKMYIQTILVRHNEFYGDYEFSKKIKDSLLPFQSR